MGVNIVKYDGKVLIDLSGLTVTPQTLFKGVTACQADGEFITGTYVPGSGGDDIDSVLQNGFSYGEIEYVDNGSIIVAANITTGQILTKTFSGDACTIVLTNSSGEELGRLVKTYSDDYSVITNVNHHSGNTSVKTFTDVDAVMEEITKNTITGEIVSSMTKKLVVQ
ncbi:MAG: hypothetical protein NC548_65465 [Lachnospiraceae bacterium]|nr:hypothetical protein [Lachnospiraceae bacterium]